jgi:hypothetical protein
LVVANELPDHITFRLSGPKAFLRAILDRHEDPISVYLSGEQPGMRTYQFYSNQIRLPQGIQVVSFSPNTITARLEYLRKKDVPLKVELRSNFPPGVQLSRLEVIPPLVRVRGADTHVEAINEIRSLPVDVSNITQSGDYPLTIEWARVGVQYDGPSPVMRLTLRKSRGE